MDVRGLFLNPEALEHIRKRHGQCWVLTGQLAVSHGAQSTGRRQGPSSRSRPSDISSSHHGVSPAALGRLASPLTCGTLFQGACVEKGPSEGDRSCVLDPSHVGTAFLIGVKFTIFSVSKLHSSVANSHCCAVIIPMELQNVFIRKSKARLHFCAAASPVFPSPSPDGRWSAVCASGDCYSDISDRKNHTLCFL